MGGQGLRGRSESGLLGLLPVLRQPLLHPALPRHAGPDAVLQQRLQGLDLGQEAVQVAQEVLAPPAFSRRLHTGLCEQEQRETLTRPLPTGQP